MDRSARDKFGRPNGFASGFTLVEMLVVVGILALLMGLLAPMVMRAYSAADKTAIAADLQGISTALDAYKADFGDFPRPVDGVGDDGRGARLLAWALVGPKNSGTGGDGHDGPGFKAGVGTKVYGPYLNMTHYRLNTSATAFADPVQTVILDKSGYPIAYLPADPLQGRMNRNTGEAYFNVKTNFAGSYTSAPGSAASHVLFNLADFPQLTDSGTVTALDKFNAMLGDTNINGSIDNTETPLYTGPFILWSAGANGIYGPEANDAGLLTSSSVDKCDDVLNFTR